MHKNITVPFPKRLFLFVCPSIYRLFLTEPLIYFSSRSLNVLLPSVACVSTAVDIKGIVFLSLKFMEHDRISGACFFFFLSLLGFFIYILFLVVTIWCVCLFPQAPTSPCFQEADTCAPPRGHAAVKLSLLERESTTVTQTPRIP